MWRVFSLTFVLYSIKIVFCGFGSFIFLCEMLFLFKDLTCYRENASKEKEISFSIVLLYRSAHFIWKNCFIFYCAISGEQVTSDSSVLFCFVLSQKKIKWSNPIFHHMCGQWMIADKTQWIIIERKFFSKNQSLRERSEPLNFL